MLGGKDGQGNPMQSSATHVSVRAGSFEPPDTRVRALAARTKGHPEHGIC